MLTTLLSTPPPQDRNTRARRRTAGLVTRAAQGALAAGLLTAVVALALSSPVRAEDPPPPDPPVVIEEDVRQAAQDATDGKITPEQYRAVVKQWMAQGKPTERPQKPETPPAEQQQPQGDPQQQQPQGDQPQYDPQAITIVEEPVQRSEELQFSPQLQRSPGNVPWYLDDRRQIDGTEQFGTHDIPCPTSFWCDYEAYKKSATGMKDTRSKAQFDIDVREQYRAWRFTVEGNPRFDPRNPTARYFELSTLAVGEYRDGRQVNSQRQQYCAAITNGGWSGVNCDRSKVKPEHRANHVVEGHTRHLSGWTDADEVARNLKQRERLTGYPASASVDGVEGDSDSAGLVVVRDPTAKKIGCHGTGSTRCSVRIPSFGLLGTTYNIGEVTVYDDPDDPSQHDQVTLAFSQRMPQEMRNSYVLEFAGVQLPLRRATITNRGGTDVAVWEYPSGLVEVLRSVSTATVHIFDPSIDELRAALDRLEDE